MINIIIISVIIIIIITIISIMIIIIIIIIITIIFPRWPFVQMISEEVTSSRAAEKYSSKPPSSKEQHRKDKNDDDDDDDDDDDKDAVKKDDDDDDGKHKAKSWRKTGKSTEKMKNGGKTNEQHLYRSSSDDRAEERMPERLLEYSSYEPSLLLKIVWGLEQFSLSASDLNVVVFFFLLPWFRQLWR